jgi:acyl transferase domain-containing protein
MADGPSDKTTTDIAVIGMACQFAGAKDVRSYWRNICRGLDAVGEVPPERWRSEDFYSEDRLARDRIYSRWGAFLDPVVFDPVKWGIPPASVRHIEPMQLLSLEVAWQAMVDAGYDPLRGKSEIRNAKSEKNLGASDFAFRASDFPRERAGVLFALAGTHEFGQAYCVGTMMRHYLPRIEGLAPEVREQIYAGLDEQLPPWSEDSFAGYLGNVIAGRIAREFDFHGPNFAVDAACAASLAALFTAVEFLRSGSVDFMLVGGADGTNNPFGFMSFARTQALSPRGKSRAFDDSGDGIALGEGVAVVALKRLADAERDGDRIHAVIKGIGSSSDGKNRSLTAPHPPGQMRAVERAYEDAGFSPATVTLIEAHGTGTAVGDSAELTTLTQVFAPHTDERQCVAVGSVKSMIGHTKTVAGLASLIKTILSLKHRVLAPTLHVEKPCTRVDLANSPFYLNTETRPWAPERGEQPRRAGVSSFGFGGTNFHVLLEEYAAAEELNWTPRGAEVIVLERANRADLLRDLRQLHHHIAEIDTDNIAELAAAVLADENNRASPSRACRLAVVAASVEDLRHKIQKALSLLPKRQELNDPSGIYYSESAPLGEAQICFLYPGQGSQSANMLRDLAVGCSWSHDLFLEANRLLREELPQPLTRFLYPPPVFDDSERQRQTTALHDTRIAQPALGVVELFATDLLERFGIRPAFVAGHSYGEHVALHVAGCLSRRDLLRLSAYRGRVCAEAAAACPGAMIAVQADASNLHLDGEIHVANRNAPDQTVIAGSIGAIDAAIERLSRQGVRTRKLAVSAAFHTPLLSAAAESMRNFLAGIAIDRPRLPVYSNTSGQRHAEEPERIRHLLARHFCEPVLFEQEVRQLYADGARVFVEAGPGKVLTDLVPRILAGQSATALALDCSGGDGWTSLGRLLARLTVLGLPVRWEEWFEKRGLNAGSVEEFLAQVRARKTAKATDWLLSPNKASPLSAMRHPPSATENGQRVADNGKRKTGEAVIMTANAERNGDHGLGGIASAGSDPIAQFQATTRLLLEAQQAQNRVLERYLDIQERLLFHHGQNGAMPSAAEVVPAAPRLRPPVPIPRAPSVNRHSLSSHTNGDKTVENRSERIGSAGGAKAPVVHAPASSVRPPIAEEQGGPPTEAFRRDLLEAVSARTGYPIDALDENLALEAELGIDSIKTVEIFSSLKAYHAYFRAAEQQEEELLAEFTKLKTLRDIVDSYDRRRHRPHPERGSEESQRDLREVERYVVTSAAAPREPNGEKKNVRRDSSL